VAHLEPRRSDGDGTPNRTQTGSKSHDQGRDDLGVVFGPNTGLTKW
jgi:hypothetical protein